MKRYYVNIECRVKNFIKIIKVMLLVVVDRLKKIVLEGREFKILFFILRYGFQVENFNLRYYDEYVFIQMRLLFIRQNYGFKILLVKQKVGAGGIFIFFYLVFIGVLFNCLFKICYQVFFILLLLDVLLNF